MDKIKWIIGFIVILLWTFLSFVSGDYLDWIDKDKICPEIVIKDSSYTKPLPPQTAHLEISKPGKPKSKDTSGIIDLHGDLDSIGFVPSYLPSIYSETIDTTIIFQNDSLDFVADINFSTKSQKFMNFFDFNLRTTEKIKGVVKEVPIPMKPEIWQEPLVIILGLLTAFFGALAL